MPGNGLYIITEEGVYIENTNLTEKSAKVPIVKEIRPILDTAHNSVARQVNNELLNTYWDIGRIICEYEQSIPK